MTTTWIKLAKTFDVPEGAVKVFPSGEQRVALAHTKDGFFAMQDLCTHDDGPLGEGAVADGQVECPRHGARFDIKTGAATRMPAIVPVKAYPVKVEGTDVLVQI